MKKLLLVIIVLAFFSNLSVAEDTKNETKDCFEGLNRATFSLNQTLDKTIFRPIAKGYRHLPAGFRKGTGNAVNNLSNLITIPNNFLQGEGKKAGTNIARLFINSTVGILGIFDPAAKLGFEAQQKEDYGQTLGSWGVKSGCYIVLPVLGPSTVRDSIGAITNVVGGDPWYNVTMANDTTYFKESDYWATKGTTGVDFRAKNIESFDSLENNSIDFYASVRSLYLQDRKQKISNSNKVTETMDDSDWEEISSD
jgi:phospholipid-binding lipoprotein MlaA